MIAAFNANGSLAHLLFSPGSSVLQSVKRPLSYNSAKTNLRLQGDISPLNFLLLHPPCLSVCSHSASICPGRREPNGEDEMASQLWCCQTARDGVYCVTNDWHSAVSRRRFATDGRERWRDLNNPSGCSLGGMRRGRGVIVLRGGSGDSWPADNAGQELDRFDMWTCPHLCWGKATPCCRPISVHSTLLKGNTHQTEFQKCA